MLDLDKIIKIELTSPSGDIITSAERECLSTPKNFVSDETGSNIVIIKGRDLPSFSFSHAIYLVAYMKNGDRLRYTGTIRMSLPHQINVQLHSDYGVVMPERRRYFKVESDLNCNINAFLRDDREIEYEIPLAASIKNISIGGIFLMCTDHKFSPDDTLLINFMLDGEITSVTAKVLRAQKGADGKIEGYGCQFINADKVMEEKFAKLVYTLQLKKRSERQEKEERRLDVIGSERRRR